MADIPVSDPPVWPSEIRLAAGGRVLNITFEDGRSAALSAELLRVMSPSAEVQGHAPHQRKTVPSKKNVTIIGVEPVGNYAVRLRFDDMHESGIYSWPLLYHFARDGEALFAAYCAQLEAKGLGRT